MCTNETQVSSLSVTSVNVMESKKESELLIRKSKKCWSLITTSYNFKDIFEVTP